MSDDTRSVLTPTQRDFLRNRGDYYTGEYAKQQRYDRREEIKERIETAADDLSWLSKNEADFLSNVPEETWDELLEAVLRLHPNPPIADATVLRRLASELNKTADRIDQKD